MASEQQNQDGETESREHQLRPDRSFRGLEGSRGPSQIQNQAKPGASKMMKSDPKD